MEDAMGRPETLAVLPGEGEERTRHERCVRIECDQCDAPAHFRVTYLLEGFRSNPGSSAYGRDDCSYCEDASAFACREHVRDVERDVPHGYVLGCTFSATERFAHRFLAWQEVDDD